MALPDISFSNNLGSISWKRAMLEVSDEWRWDGRNAVRRKRIGVRAYISKSPDEALHAVLTDPTATATGRKGTLTLPWGVLSNIRIESIEFPTSAWNAVYVPVTAEFSDDHPDGNTYTLHFFGLELHNPKLAINVPTRQVADYYVQTPDVPLGDVDHTNPWYGAIRYKQGFGMMSVRLSGTVLCPEGTLPTDLVETLQQRNGVGGVSGGNLPDGFPRTFNLSEAVPEFEGQLEVNGCFVVSSRAIWNVERQAVRVELVIGAQPQGWAEAE
jgi:hypothetical protein